MIESRPGRGLGARIAAVSALLLAAFLPGVVFGAERDYASVFGAKYAEAARIMDKDGWLEAGLCLAPAETRLARAVVFPEVLRYSVLQDALEVRALKVLYVQYGRGFVNFSVGLFQMKPSFIENLESDWMSLFSVAERVAAGLAAFDRSDTPIERRRRIARLEDPAWQAAYLRMFIRIMDKLYPASGFPDEESRVRFYAAAYNAGYRSGERAIRKAMGERRYHTALLFPRDTYCYSDISAYYHAHSNPGSRRGG